MPRDVAEGPPTPPWLAYGLSLAACAGAAVLGSLATTPHLDPWYQTLAKPGFTPPNAVFPIVWPVLFLLMAIAAARVATRPRPTPARGTALAFFAAQLTINVLWSFAFFGRESPEAGMLTIVILIAAIAATLIVFWRIDRPAGLLLVPYLAWVAFAAVLNAAIVALN
jgi:tryptophan-rich sensory protein